MLSQYLVMLSVWGGFFAEAKLFENVLKNINVQNEIIFSVYQLMTLVVHQQPLTFGSE